MYLVKLESRAKLKSKRFKEREELIFHKRLNNLIRQFIKIRAYGLRRFILVKDEDQYRIDEFITSLNRLYPDYNFSCYEEKHSFRNMSYSRPYITWEDKYN